MHIFNAQNGEWFLKFAYQSSYYTFMWKLIYEISICPHSLSKPPIQLTIQFNANITYSRVNRILFVVVVLPSSVPVTSQIKSNWTEIALLSLLDQPPTQPPTPGTLLPLNLGSWKLVCRLISQILRWPKVFQTG